MYASQLLVLFLHNPSMKCKFTDQLDLCTMVAIERLSCDGCTKRIKNAVKTLRDRFGVTGKERCAILQ